MTTIKGLQTEICSSSACFAIARGDVNQWLGESNHMTSRLMAEVTANDVITVIRLSKLSNLKVSQSESTNRLINFELTRKTVD